jgi:nitrogen fixation/metabolism regulation signal transduction histidine kinase
LFGMNGRQVLMCRGTTLQSSGRRGSGLVVVFDDVTALIQAQRDAAWGEVARRLAHEIKNPLTPIQLSAERLRHRFMASMAPDEVEILDRATRTIVNQVEAMKTMVNAFSEYARVPQICMELLNLNPFVREVLDLYRGGDLNVQIVEQLEAETDCIDGDAGRLRQLLHNLLKNALEAVRETPNARITVITRLLPDDGKDRLELCVEDNGPGFDAGVLENVFEPYVSTKLKGSGLGLAIVKKIVEEHGGTISAENSGHGGAQIRIRFLLSTVDANVECDHPQHATDATPTLKGEL